MRHLLDVDDLSPDEFSEVLELSAPDKARPVLAGRGVALVFEKPSSRTRNSCEMAVVGLGGHPVYIRGDEVGIGEREAEADVARVLGRYHAIVGARVHDHRRLEAMAAATAVPVVNLLSERSHPLQAIADILTLQQRWGSLAGHSVAWVGDGNNVARSLLLACAMTGINVRLACPPGHGLDPVAVDGARAMGVEVLETDDPIEASRNADAVYTDVWVSMGQEAESPQRLEAFRRYQVNAPVMEAAASRAVFLHCLPAHRGLEVTAEVIDGPASAVWDQAENRMHAARGLFMWLVTRD